MKRKVLIVDPSRCTGCEACAYSCSAKKSGTPSRVWIKSDEAEGRFRPVLCAGCVDMPCLAVCPSGAISFSRRVSTPLINPSKCTGCGACSQICPFEAIILDQERRIAFKCDLCGGQPVCADACIPGAIRYVPFKKEICLDKYRVAVDWLEFHEWSASQGKY